MTAEPTGSFAERGWRLANEADTLSLYVKVIQPIKGVRVRVAVKSATRDLDFKIHTSLTALPSPYL